MNAVERVRENFRNQPIKPFNYDEGYIKALNDVQAELDKEVSGPCFDDLASRHATTIMELNKEIQYKEAELKEYKAKLEMVELIFGGK